MKGFPGFPEGKLRLTPIPNLFFSDLLPQIDDLSEMKVVLYAFWALGKKDGPVGDAYARALTHPAKGREGLQEARVRSGHRLARYSRDAGFPHPCPLCPRP